MSGPDWHDPFADERDAEERARRRAERGARREGFDHQGNEEAGEQAEPHRDPHPDTPPADPGFEWTDSARRTQPSDVGPGGVPPQLLWFRRALGLLAVLAMLAVVVFVLAKLVDAIGGEDAPSGPATLATGDVLIPEGLTRRQIADEVEKQVAGNYMKATKEAPKGFPIGEYAPDGTPPNLEGFLFPDTYNVEKGAGVNDLVQLQLDNFQRQIRRVDMRYAEARNLNVYDVLKIASIIEREIAVPKERKLASAVVYNRLAAGDTLGMDATTRYGLQNYDEQLTQSELEDASNPYNTRVHPGLPPTPIGNPGLASIKAAANPAKSDAYYFVIKPGTCNEHTFVATNEEFLEAEAEYQAALEAEGGSPTEC